MLRILFSAILVSAFAFLHTGSALAASVQGTHPYDLQSRRVSGGSAHRTSGSWGYETLREFELSPYRSVTHMLHPYFRSRPYQQFLPSNKRTFRLFIEMYGYDDLYRRR
ncbi:MAG: hypothetical protein KAS32_06240 [Candidatus Peribacteraceae bacterium]|nr:hypothetical protein [Candidatus Peribacteraceae bacterium]